MNTTPSSESNSTNTSPSTLSQTVSEYFWYLPGLGLKKIGTELGNLAIWGAKKMWEGASPVINKEIPNAAVFAKEKIKQLPTPISKVFQKVFGIDQDLYDFNKLKDLLTIIVKNEETESTEDSENPDVEAFVILVDTMSEIKKCIIPLIKDDYKILNELTKNCSTNELNLYKKLLNQLADFSLSNVEDDFDEKAEVTDEPELIDIPVMKSFIQVLDGILKKDSNFDYMEMIQQLPQTLQQTLTKQPPKELIEVNQIFKTIVEEKEVTLQSLKKALPFFNLLSANNNELLHKLAPNLTREELDICNLVFELTVRTVQKKNANNPTEIFKIGDKENLQILEKFVGILDQIRIQNQGVFTQLIQPSDPLLQICHNNVTQLQKAVNDKNMSLAKILSLRLDPQLKDLLEKKATVFTKSPLTEDEETWVTLISQSLPTFYAESPNKEDVITATLNLNSAAEPFERCYQNNISPLEIHTNTAKSLVSQLQNTTQTVSNTISGVKDVLTGVQSTYNNFMGIDPSNPTAATSVGAANNNPPAHAGNPAAQDSLSRFLASGGTYLSTALAAGVGMLSKQFLSGFGNSIAMGLKTVLGELNLASSVHPQAKSALETLINRLENSKEISDWNQLVTSIFDAARSDALKDIKINANGLQLSIGNIDPADIAFLEIEKIAANIPLSFSTSENSLSPEITQKLSDQLEVLGKHIETLRKLNYLQNEVKTISEEKEKIAKTLGGFNKIHAMNSFAEELKKPNSPFEHYVEGKKLSLAGPLSDTNLDQKFSELKNRLTTSIGLTENDQLIVALEKIQNATQLQEIEAAHLEFNAVLSKMIEEAALSTSEGKKQLIESSNAIKQASQKTNLTNPLLNPETNSNISLLNSVKDNLTESKDVKDSQMIWENQSKEGKNALIEEEKDKLIFNTSYLLAMKEIYESACGKPESDREYFDLLAKAKVYKTETGELGGLKRIDFKASELKLKELLFEKISANNVNFFTKTWARVKYFFYISIVKYYVTKASNIYFSEIIKYIEKNQKDDFNSFRNQLLGDFDDYLCALGGAYEKVSKKEPVSQLNKMLATELDKKEFNGNKETSEHYVDFAKIVLKKTTSGILAFPPIDWLIRKIVGNPGEIVEKLVEKATGSIIDTNGYTHALNTVLREQLDAVWNELKKGEANKSNDTNTEISPLKKEELTRLVKNLFSVLRKSNCDNMEELRNVIGNVNTTDRINQAIENLFIQDILEKVATLLATTTQSLIKEDQLKKLTYKFATLANRSFETGAPVPPNVMQEEEEKIAERCDQILHFAVGTAIKNKFDLTGEKQQKATNEYIQKLRTESTNYLKNVKLELESLKQMDFRSLPSETRINSIIETAYAYEIKCKTTCDEAKAANINDDNKGAINQRFLKATEQSKPFIEAIATMKKCSTAIKEFEVSRLQINEIQKIIRHIIMSLSDKQNPLTPETIKTLKSHELNLEKHLETLKKSGNYENQIKEITLEKEKVAQILVSLGEKIEMKSVAEELNKPNSLLEQIVEGKKQSIGHLLPNPELDRKISELKKMITLSMEPTLKTQLSQQLEKIQKAKHLQDIETAHLEFKTLLKKPAEMATLSLNQGIIQLVACNTQIKKASEETKLLDPNFIEITKQKGEKAIEDALLHQETLEKWAKEHIHDVTFVNFHPINLKWGQSFIENMVYSNVKGKVDSFLNLLKDPVIYKSLFTKIGVAAHNRANGFL